MGHRFKQENTKVQSVEMHGKSKGRGRHSSHCAPGPLSYLVQAQLGRVKNVFAGGAASSTVNLETK